MTYLDQTIILTVNKFVEFHMYIFSPFFESPPMNFVESG